MAEQIRNNRFLKTKEYYKKNGKFTIRYIVPTDANIINILSEEDQKVRLDAINRYQFINRIIRSLYDLTSPDQLSNDTKNLLRASVSLWPYLKYETLNSGHPDEAVEEVIIKSNTTKKICDLTYYLDHIYKSNFEVEMKNWCREKVFLYGTRADFKQAMTSSLPEAEWLLPKPCKIEKHFFSEKKESDLIEVQKETSKRQDTVEALIENHKSENPIVTVEERELVVNNSLELTLLDSVEFASTSIAIQEEKADLFSSEKVNASFTTNTYIAPKGNRIFHSLRPIKSEFTPLNELKRNHLNIISNIFDKSKKGFGITFGDFKKVWIRINGENSISESGGGSHRELLDKSGNVVGSTYAHNDSQTYGHKTIRYLQDALYTIGYRPDCK